MEKLLYIAAGGALGAIGRYLLGAWVHKPELHTFPWGTLTVNLLGCFCIGLLWGLAEFRQALSENFQLFLITGILGGFTTYSAFGYETFALLRDNHLVHALGNLGLTLSGGLLAVYLGFSIARQFSPI